MSIVADEIKSVVDKVVSGLVGSDDVMKQLFEQLQLASGDKVKKVLHENNYGGFSVNNKFKKWYIQYMADNHPDVQLPNENDYTYYGGCRSKFREQVNVLEYGKYILSQDHELNTLMRKVWPWINKLMIYEPAMQYLSDFDACRVSGVYKFNSWNKDIIKDTVDKLNNWLTIFGEDNYAKLLDYRGIINLPRKYNGKYSLILQAFLDWRYDNNTVELKDEGDTIPDVYIEQLGLDYLDGGNHTSGRSTKSIEHIPYYVPYIINEYDGSESVIYGYHHPRTSSCSESVNNSDSDSDSDDP
jgi:hypothetical protein